MGKLQEVEYMNNRGFPKPCDTILRCLLVFFTVFRQNEGLLNHDSPVKKMPYVGLFNRFTC